MDIDLTADDINAVYNTKKFDCSICYAEVEPGEGLVLRGCIHEFCKYVGVQVLFGCIWI